MTTQGQRRDSQSWQDRLRDGTITPEGLLADSLPDQQRVVAERYRSQAYKSIARHISEEELLNGVYSKLGTRVVENHKMPTEPDQWLQWIDDDCWGVGRDLRRTQTRHAKYHEDNTRLESIIPQSEPPENDLGKLPPQLIHLFATLGIVTQREAEVLSLYLLTAPTKKSKRNRRHKRAIVRCKEIASQLRIREDGVRKHLASAIKKIEPVYRLIEADILPEGESPLNHVGLPPLLISPFFDCLAMVGQKVMQTWPEFVDKPAVIDWSELRPDREVARGLRLSRRITETEGCEFWIAEDKDYGTIGVKIRPITDVRWLIDFWMDFIIRREGRQLTDRMKMCFEDIPLRQTICWPWMINQCERSERSALDVLAEWQRNGMRGIDGKTLLPLLVRTVWEIYFLSTINLSHRNISPTNLVLCSNGLRLCDYGDAAWKDADLPNLTATPYQAPEVIAGRPHKGSDQYSFAMTYHYLRTGKLPFKNMPEGRANEEPDLSLVTEPEREVLALALRHNPSERLDFTVGLDKLMSITNW